MRITMIGGGYVGLVSGACFAEFGSEVTLVEADPRKLGALRDGRMPIYEPGLDNLVQENVAAGRLAFTDDLASAVDGTEAVFIAVGTPTRRGDGHADLTYVYAAVGSGGTRVDRLYGRHHQIHSSCRYRSSHQGNHYSKSDRIWILTLLRTRNFCVRAMRSATSCARIGW